MILLRQSTLLLIFPTFLHSALAVPVPSYSDLQPRTVPDNFDGTELPEFLPLPPSEREIGKLSGQLRDEPKNHVKKKSAMMYINGGDGDADKLDGRIHRRPILHPVLINFDLL